MKAFIPYVMIGLAIAVGMRLVHVVEMPWIGFLSKGFAFLVLYGVLVVWCLSKEDIMFLKRLTVRPHQANTTMNE